MSESTEVKFESGYQIPGEVYSRIAQIGDATELEVSANKWGKVQLYWWGGSSSARLTLSHAAARALAAELLLALEAGARTEAEAPDRAAVVTQLQQQGLM